MSIARDSRQKRKWKLIRRAQFRLKQQLEYVDFLEDVLYPECAAIDAGKPIPGLLDAGSAFDIQVTHADQADPKADNPDQS